MNTLKQIIQKEYGDWDIENMDFTYLEMVKIIKEYLNQFEQDLKEIMENLE